MKHILKNILAVLNRTEKRQFGILSLLDIIISILDILSLAALLWIIRIYIQPQQNNHSSFLPGWLTNKSPVAFIAVFVFLFSIKNLAGFFIARGQFKFIGRIGIRISRSNLENYQQARFSEFVNVDSSVHIRNIAFQPFDFCLYMLSGLQQMITQLSLILITIIAIILFNAKLFLLLLLILLPPVIIVFYFIKKRLTVAKKHIQSGNERSFRNLLDALKGYVEGNIYNRNDFFLKRFIDSRQMFSKHLFDSLSLQNLPNRIIEIFAVMGLFILILIIHWTGNSDSATLITIGAFMAAAYRIIPGIVKLINLGGQMKAYEFSVNDLQQNKIKDTEVIKSLEPIRSVEFKNISFTYENRQVLQDLSFTMKTGDFIGITGQSGKGKTTILNLLLGFLPAVNGEIFINNLLVDDEHIKNYWSSVSYVRQQHFFIHDTLLRNITLEENEYDEKRLEHALNISGLEKIIATFPEGLNKIISENGKNISGGQQQRISIARALYKNATVILLDEPFNELDDEATNTILEHFRLLATEGKIVVMITHEQKSLSYCNKIISLDEG